MSAPYAYEFEDLETECEECAGTGWDGNPRDWQKQACDHCHGTGIEPRRSPADHDADRADAERKSA
jgi:DnaJ-class molecular chaperone